MRSQSLELDEGTPSVIRVVFPVPGGSDQESVAYRNRLLAFSIDRPVS